MIAPLPLCKERKFAQSVLLPALALAVDISGTEVGWCLRRSRLGGGKSIEATQALLELLAWRVEQGEAPVGEICLLKNQATQTMAHCASEGVQIFGGAGFMRGAKVERIYREVKVNAIGGGTEEIMKDLASRQMGL